MSLLVTILILLGTLAGDSMGDEQVGVKTRSGSFDEAGPAIAADVDVVSVGAG